MAVEGRAPAADLRFAPDLLVLEADFLRFVGFDGAFSRFAMTALSCVVGLRAVSPTHLPAAKRRNVR